MHTNSLINKEMQSNTKLINLLVCTTYVCTKGTVSLLKLIGWSKFGPGEICSQETATLREQLNIVASF